MSALNLTQSLTEAQVRAVVDLISGSPEVLATSPPLQIAHQKLKAELAYQTERAAKRRERRGGPQAGAI